MNASAIRTILSGSRALHKKIQQLRSGILGVLVSCAVLAPTTALGWDYSDVPLFWVQGIKPNVVMMLDNSGSMQALSTNEAFSRATVSGDIDAAPLDTDWYWCTDYDNSSKKCTAGTTRIDKGFSVFAWTPPTINKKTDTVTGTITVKATPFLNTITAASSCLSNSSGVFGVSPSASSPAKNTTYTSQGICLADYNLPEGAKITKITLPTGVSSVSPNPSTYSPLYVINNAAYGFQLSSSSGGSVQSLTIKTSSTTVSGSFTLSYSYPVDSYEAKLPTYIANTSASTLTVSLCNVTKSPGNAGFYLGQNGDTISSATAAGIVLPAENEVGVLVTNKSGGGGTMDSCVRWKMASTGRTASDRDYVPWSSSYKGTLYYMDGRVAEYGEFLLNTLINAKGSYNFDDSSTYPDQDTADTTRAWDTDKDKTVSSGGTATDNKYFVIPNTTRMEAAREAGQKIVLDFYDKMNIGLYTLNNTRQRAAVPDGSNPSSAKTNLIGSTESMLAADLPSSALDGKIGVLDPDTGGTPLANTQKDINDYFKGGSSPIKYRCQKNYAVVMTDGEPTSDSGTLDGRAQEGYDTDAKTTGNDSDGKSWDDSSNDNRWKIQNIVTYTIGLGLENNLLKRTPLVNQVKVAKSGIVDNVITLSKHGLTTGDYVQVVSGAVSGLTNGNYYYAVVIDADHFKLAGAGTTTSTVTVADTYTTTVTETRTCKSGKTCKATSNTNWNSWTVTNTSTSGITSTTDTTNGGGITGDTDSSSANSRNTAAACAAGTSLSGGTSASPFSTSNQVSQTTNPSSGNSNITTQTRVTVTEYKTGTTTTTTATGGCSVITGGGSGDMVLSTGPGKSFFSFTPDQLASDMGKVFNQINNLTSSASAVSTNTKQFSGTETALVYQARFNTEDWSGEVAAYEIKVDSSTGKATVDTSPEATPYWSTQNTLLSAGQRTSNIFTWNRTNNAGKGSAVDLSWSNLDAAQQTALGGATSGANVISWLKGNNVGGLRAHSNKGLLGDILNSDPVYLSYLSMGYNTLPPSSSCTIASDYSSASGSGCTGAEIYNNYVTSSKTRTPMIYVGANDGMLHALDANNGTEKMAFLPAAVYRDWNDVNNNGLDDDGAANVQNKLLNLTSPSYDHRYFVDGSLTVGDVFLGSTWGTYLVGALGRGGRSVFAMDVTDTNYTASNIKWEFTHQNLGYTYGKPVIARLADNQWYAIFPNGLDSNQDKASVFIVNLANANDYHELTTNVGSPAVPNGMMAVQVKVNGTRTVTDIYAGDMRGNIWKFDVFNESANAGAGGVQWSNGSKLFTAGDGTTGTPQAITGGIRIGKHPDGLGSLVYFGTGKYFETQDNIFNGSSVPQVDSFYAVLDNGTSTSITRSQLEKQEFVMDGDSLRTSSKNAVSYASKMGWYIDLLDGAGTKKGERMVSTPVLYGGRVIFVTIKPLSGGTCGGEGSSWLNELDALDGSMLPERVLDTNNDGKIDNADKIVSSAQLDGLASDPSIISGQDRDYKVIGSTSTTKSVQIVSETAPDAGGGLAGGKGRMSWRQLQ